MKRYIFLLALLSCGIGLQAQKLIKVENLINKGSYGSGEVEINQDIRVDSLVSRHIMANAKTGGINGYRIQIYRGSGRNAREKANEAKAEFISSFPDIPSYLKFDLPNYFKVRAGNYRTKHDAYADFLMVKEDFPNAYLVTDVIAYPDIDK
ncbi:MAG: hypothetical protein U5K32_02720 [Bacteroidales bacterium]|nr:hypothetical protein [Bacteroidales bacterium]